MENDPDWWRSPVTSEEWAQEQAEADERRKQREEKLLARYARNAARHEEFKDNPKLRKWAMWRQYRAGGTTFREVGEDFGVTLERARQSVGKCDRLLRTALSRVILTVPVLDEVRDATLGVEFVFRNELTFTDEEDQKGWTQLEWNVSSSAYDEPIPEWRREWGYQDTSPAKPIPAYTFFKAIIPKEQTDGE